MKFTFPFRKYRDDRSKEVGRLLSRTLHIRFKDLNLYILALRHKSAARNILNRPELSNERLEFLGDAILDAVVAEYLYQKHPAAEEGEMTKMKSRIVSRSNLNIIAKKMGVDRLLETDLQASNSRDSIAGNALEALFGALYLDLGYERTRKTILYLIRNFADLEELEYHEADFKSRLYEEAHKLKQEVKFVTEALESKNGTHQFYSRVFLDGEFLGKGQGSSKKKAEQEACEKALHVLDLSDR